MKRLLTTAGRARPGHGVKALRVQRAVVALAAAAGIFALVQGAQAASITYNFTGPTLNANADLGSSSVISNFQSGGPNITATAGTWSYSGPPANNIRIFNTTGSNHLVGDNRGTDEQGMGVCGTSAGGCSGSALQNDGEIDYTGNEVVRLDITNLFSTYGNFQINADSATGGELLGVFSSNSAGSLGTKLADITSVQNNVAISPTGDFLFFISDSNLGGGDVLLHSLTVTPADPPVPEPASLALFGVGLLGLGFVTAKRRN